MVQLVQVLQFDLEGGQVAHGFDSSGQMRKLTLTQSTHKHLDARMRTCTEGFLDQRAAVLFGRPTSDPFRAAHTGASCHAELALLEFCGQRKK